MYLSSLKTYLRPALFLGAIFLKFWLIWASEIRDASDDPHEYVLQVLYPGQGGLFYPPGTGLVGSFFHNLGLPFRLGMEIAYLLAITLVVRALFAWPWRKNLPFGLFLLAAFDPAVVELFTHFYSDPVWLVETLLGLAFFGIAFREEGRLDWKYLLLSLGFFNLSLLTRIIAVPLLASTIIFALVALGLLVVKFRSKKVKRSLDLLALTIPTLIFGLSLTVVGAARWNYVHHGYMGLSLIDCAEFKNLYLSLQSVGEPDGPPYYPIDENRRQLIAKAGPYSRQFVTALDDNIVYKDASFKEYGRPDIACGWFPWAAYTAAMDPTKGEYMTAFTLFGHVQDEIAAADRRGILQVRQVIPLPDVRVAIVAGVLPSGIGHTIMKIVQEPSPSEFTASKATYADPDFTHALNRRTVSGSPLRNHLWGALAFIYGWLYTPITFALLPIALGGWMVSTYRRWASIEEFSLSFVTLQFFIIIFLAYLGWYSVFDASGMPVTSRYMMLNHVLLVPLAFFYAVEWHRLVRKTN